MKPSLRFLAFALGTGLAFAAPTAAHAQVSVGVQIGAPAWGPPVQQGTQYYYIPEIDGYYDIYNGTYLVLQDGVWVTLPYIDGYDPYYFHPVPVSYVGPRPWLYINSYRNYYPQYVSGYRLGGWGGGDRYYGHEYGAGRVYGYDHGNRGGFGRPGYNGFGDRDRPGFNPGPGNRGSFGRPGNNGFGDGRPNPGNPGPGNGGGFGGRPAGPGGFQGGGNAGGALPQPQRGGFGGGQPGGGRGGFQGGGGQPGGGFGGNHGGGGQPGGGGGRRGGR